MAGNNENNNSNRNDNGSRANAVRERETIKTVYNERNEKRQIAYEPTKSRKVQTKLIDPNFPRPIPIRYCTDSYKTSTHAVS